MSDLLVDGEEFGGAGVVQDVRVVRRVVAEHFQRAGDLESLVDDLKPRRRRERLRRRNNKPAVSVAISAHLYCLKVYRIIL